MCGELLVACVCVYIFLYYSPLYIYKGVIVQWGVNTNNLLVILVVWKLFIELCVEEFNGFYGGIYEVFTGSIGFPVWCT